MSTEPRKVRLSTVRRPDMTLVIPDADGEHEHEYTVRGQLTIDEMIDMYSMQKVMSAGVVDDNPVPMMEAVRDSQRFLTALIQERYPEAPPIDHLGLEEMTMGFMAMLGGVTAADKIAQTLMENLDVDETEEVPETGGDPTSPLSTRSSPPSSDSASTTGGNRSGGVESPGEPSLLT